MKRGAFLLAVLLAATPAMGQRADGKQGAQGQRKAQGMTKAERQQLRDDMRQVNREKGQRQERRQMSPEQRESLRRDMQDANRNLKKR